MTNKTSNVVDSGSSSIKKLSVLSVVLMIFPVVFSFNNSAVAFYKMGYASIIWYILGGLAFFLPLMFIIAEYAFSFRNSEGGLQTWISNSKGNFFGFVTVLMFYFAQVFWMVSFSTTRIWIPLSYMILGRDATSALSILGLNSTQTIGLLSIAFIVGITYFATRGFNKVSMFAKIGGISCITINIVLFSSALLIAALKLFKGEPLLAEQIKNVQTFIIPPNENVANIFSIIGFMSFATFAYAGPEVFGNLANKTKTENTFSKGILISLIFITIGYSASIFLWGFVQNSLQMNQNPAINFGNVLYNSMANLGTGLGKAFGFDPGLSQNVFGSLFARATGLAIFFTVFGAFFAEMYAPLQAVMCGAPKGLFPEFLNKKNKANMIQNAMWCQALIICSTIAIISFGGKSAKAFYDLILLMANVSQTCHYIFIFLAFPAFRRNSNLNHSYKIFKSDLTATVAAYIGLAVVLIANIITIIEPIMTKAEGALSKAMFMAGGPFLFISITILIYKNYEKKIKNKPTY